MVFGFTMEHLHRWFLQKGMMHEMQLEDEPESIQYIRLQSGELENVHILNVYDAHMFLKWKEYDVVLLQGEHNHILFHGYQLKDVYNCAMEMMYAYDEWQRQLKKINIRRGTISELIACTVPLVSCPIVLMREHKIIGYTYQYKEYIRQAVERYMQTDFRTVLELDDLTDVCQEMYHRNRSYFMKKGYFSDDRMIMRNIWMNGQCEYKLMLFDIQNCYSEKDFGIVDQLAEAITISLEQETKGIYSKLENHEIVENRLRNMLDKPQMEEKDYQIVLDYMQWQNVMDYELFQIESQKDLSYFAVVKLFLELKKQFPDIVAVIKDDSIIVIHPKEESIDLEALKQWTAEYDCFLTKSCVGRNLRQIYQYRRQVKIVVEKQRELQVGYMEAEEWREELILKELEENQWCQSLVLPEVRMLFKEQQKKQVNGTKMAFEFLRSGGNMNLAAEHLGLHRSSLAYHMEKWKQVIGDKMQQVQGMERLIISLLIGYYTEIKENN